MTPFFLQNKPLAAIPFAPQITPSTLTFPADTSLMLGAVVDFSGGIVSWEIVRAGKLATVRAEGTSAVAGDRYTAKSIQVSMPTNNSSPPPGPSPIGRSDYIQFRCYSKQGEFEVVILNILQEFRS